MDMAEMQIIVNTWSNSWCCSLIWIYQQCCLLWITLTARNWWLPCLIPQKKYLLGSQGVCFWQSLLLHPCFSLFFISFSISQSTSLQGRGLWQSEPVTQLTQVTFSEVLFYLYLYWKMEKSNCFANHRRAFWRFRELPLYKVSWRKAQKFIQWNTDLKWFIVTWAITTSFFSPPWEWRTQTIRES